MMDNTAVMKDGSDRLVSKDKPVDEAVRACRENDVFETWQDTLLRPYRVWSPRELISDTRLLPCSPGVYGWWFRSVPPGVPVDGALKSPFGTLLYVGIAGRGKQATRTLRDRVKNHITGPIGSSTLRRTLACLNAEQLGLQIGRHPTSHRLVMSGSDEARLSEWMSEEARVAWVVCERPEELEKAIITHGPRLPLNIQGSSDPYSKELRVIRSAIGST